MHSKDNNNPFLITKDDGSFLKGAFAIFVLAHHLYQEINIVPNGIINYIFLSLGYLSVSVFFFLSGYGLSLSYQLKGNEYLSRFSQNRIAPFYLQICLLNVMYFLLNWFIHGAPNINSLINSFFLKTYLIRNGWYLMVAFLMYISFYYVYTLLRNDFHRLFALTLILTAYTFSCIHLFERGTWWYESNFSFLAGILFGTLYGCNLEIKQSIHTMILLVSTFIFILTYYLLYAKSFTFNTYILLKTISSIFFAISVCLLTAKFDFSNSKIYKLFGNISHISFEIYVSQGLFLSLLHSNAIYINNRLCYFFIVIFSTIIFSLFLSKIFKKITQIFHI